MMLKRDWTKSSVVINYSALNSECHWEDLCSYLGDQQTLASDNHNKSRGGRSGPILNLVFIDVLS